MKFEYEIVHVFTDRQFGGNPLATVSRVCECEASESSGERLLELRNAMLVALVECPLLNPFRAQQPGLGQYSKVFACGRLADSKLGGNQHAAHAILDQIAIGLPWEMGFGIL
jgi:hypothetical protein